MSKIFFIALLAILLDQGLLVPDAQAEVKQQLDAWLPVQLVLPVSEKLKLQVDYQHRRKDALRSRRLDLVEGNLFIRVHPQVNVGLGSTYVNVSPSGQDAVFLNQSVGGVIPLPGNASLNGRLRLEQIMGNNLGGTIIRGRVLVGARKRLGKTNISLVAFQEGLYNFTGSSRFLQDGLLETRTYLGLEKPVTSWVTVQGGYLLITFLPANPQAGQPDVDFRHTMVLGLRINPGKVIQSLEDRIHHHHHPPLANNPGILAAENY
jgi:hypothetical protein